MSVMSGPATRFEIYCGWLSSERHRCVGFQDSTTRFGQILYLSSWWQRSPSSTGDWQR